PDRALQLAVGVEVDGSLGEGVRVCSARGGAEADGGGPGRGEQRAARQHRCGPLGEDAPARRSGGAAVTAVWRADTSAAKNGNRLPGAVQVTRRRSGRRAAPCRAAPGGRTSCRLRDLSPICALSPRREQEVRSPVAGTERGSGGESGVGGDGW